MPDLRLALRQLIHSPGFTIVAVLTLALGIGANTAIFSVVYDVLIRPLPYPDQKALVVLSEWSEQVPGMSISYPNYLDWCERQTCFASLGVSRRQSFTYETEGGAERAAGLMASHQYFDALGLAPLKGRGFGADDDKQGAARTVLLGERLWRQEYGARDSAVGERLRLNGEVYTIVGVMPDAAMDANGSHDLAVPLGLWAAQFSDRHNHPGLYGLGRLRTGVSLAAAQKEMKALAQAMAREYPGTNSGLSVELRSYEEARIGSLRTALLLLLGAAGFVLLIACANVANLQLVKTQSRAREFGIRAALGASRGRIVAQLVAESLILGACASVGGVLLGHWTLEALVSFLPGDFSDLNGVSLNGTVLGVSVAAGLLTSLLFGLLPALYASRLDIRSVFAGGQSVAGDRHSQRTRIALVVGEFALTSLLVVGCVLMVRTLANLNGAQLGFSRERVLTFDFTLSGTGFQRPEARLQVVEQALERIGALPGVRAVAVANPLPLRGGNQSTYYVEGSQIPETGKAPSAERGQVSGDYFTALGINRLEGRAFGPEDTATAPKVAIVDKAFAEKWFKGKSPVGKRFAYGERPPKSERDWITIVGVVDHIRNFGLRSGTREQTYLPVAQSTPSDLSFAIKTERDPSALASDLRSLMKQLAPTQPVFGFRTMEDRFDSTISTERIMITLLGSFAFLAVLLASVGLYGVLSYLVGLRRREIGVRMALGAAPSNVVSLFLGQGLRLSLLGLGAGLGASLALVRLFQSLLYGVSPFDFSSFAFVAAVLTAVGLLSCWLPAWRASRVDPIQALHSD